jgi:phage terminase Nu1 subunit (DNA packaging protein)
MEKGSAATYSLTTIARLLTITPRRVQQLVREGYLPAPAERGRYELVGCVQGYIRYLKERAIRGDLGPDSHDAHRTRLVKARADIHEQQAAALCGQLIPRQRVEAVWSGILKLVRQGLLGLPSRAAPRIHDLETIPEVREVLAETVHEILSDLANVKIEYVAVGGRDPGAEVGNGDIDPGSKTAAQANG